MRYSRSGLRISTLVGGMEEFNQFCDNRIRKMFLLSAIPWGNPPQKTTGTESVVPDQALALVIRSMVSKRYGDLTPRTRLEYSLAPRN